MDTKIVHVVTNLTKISFHVRSSNTTLKKYTMTFEARISNVALFKTKWAFAFGNSWVPWGVLGITDVAFTLFGCPARGSQTVTGIISTDFKSYETDARVIAMFDPTAASAALVNCSDDEEVILRSGGDLGDRVLELSIGGSSITWEYQKMCTPPSLPGFDGVSWMQVSHSEFSRAVKLMAERCPTEAVVLSWDGSGLVISPDADDKVEAVTVLGEPWSPQAKAGAKPVDSWREWKAKILLRDLFLQNPTPNDTFVFFPFSEDFVPYITLIPPLNRRALFLCLREIFTCICVKNWKFPRLNMANKSTLLHFYCARHKEIIFSVQSNFAALVKLFLLQLAIFRPFLALSLHLPGFEKAALFQLAIFVPFFVLSIHLVVLVEAPIA